MASRVAGGLLHAARAFSSSGSRNLRTSAVVDNNAANAALQKVQPKLLIGGQFVDAKSGKTFEVIDPRTEQVIANFAEADKADVDLAVNAARKAYQDGPWRKMSAKDRGRLMYKWADLMEQHADELAHLETLDNGKPVAISAFADIPLSIGHLRYYAGWADKIHGKTIPTDTQFGNFFAYTRHEPLGVVGQITPWNFPLLMASWKWAPALAAGNTIVLKVAEQTPLTALRAGELALEAGLPEGVLNILSGYGPTAGAALASHTGIDKVAFTGSTEVGKLIAAEAAKNLIPCSLELGGKSPVIVWKDVDLDEAASACHNALFFNAGQCCAAGSRLYVHEDIYDEFVEKAAEKARARVVGDPFEAATEQGPQIDQDQFDKILSYIDAGKSAGARLMAGGKRVGEKGYYVEPTVFADAQDEFKITKEEIFGPVQTILKYSTIDEVVRRANDSEYGLAAGVFAKDVDVVNVLTRALNAGTVWTNCFNIYDQAVPFGGYKQSGIGRDKGEYALDHYTQIKAVYQSLGRPDL